MLIVILCCIIFINSKFGHVSAMSDEQRAMIHEHFEQFGKECLKDNPISSENIKKLRAKQILEGENASCFLACILKKVGIMDNAGMIQKETALDLVRKVFNDEEELKLVQDYVHSCSSVNSEAVIDGAKGCDRAMMAYKCMKENAIKFGFDL